ncbi:MAG TPA: response regulator [Longimicrobium sp.]|nr:response regulator [Longimicrobium sp.]
MDHPRTILLIDDDRDNAEICSTLLRHHGFHVAVAGDAEAGISVVRQSRPCVVITELFHRTRSGWAVLDALGSRPETAGIPVIVLSAHAFPADREAASRAAVFLAKPVYLHELLDHVRRCCEAAA